MRTNDEVICALERYADTVRRICFIHLKNYPDTEDVFQSVFLKYAMRDTDFENDEHEKAWFIRVTINECKDLLRRFLRRKAFDRKMILEQVSGVCDENKEVLEAVLCLPEKYRKVIYLHYYEGYTAQQIAGILNKNVNSIYTLITRGRNMLRQNLEDEGYE